jgi:hypothetical protein
MFNIIEDFGEDDNYELKTECNKIFLKLKKYNCYDDDTIYERLVIFKDLLETYDLKTNYKKDFGIRCSLLTICDNYMMLLAKLLTHHAFFYSWYLNEKNGKIIWNIDNMKYPVLDKIIELHKNCLSLWLSKNNILMTDKIRIKKLKLFDKCINELNTDLKKYLTKNYLIFFIY